MPFFLPFGTLSCIFKCSFEGDATKGLQPGYAVVLLNRLYTDSKDTYMQHNKHKACLLIESLGDRSITTYSTAAALYE